MNRTKKIPQPVRPSGFEGRIFGHLMQWLAAPNYHWVMTQLEPIRARSYFEIGFGTGRLAQLAATRFELEHLCGVDPSELMFKMAKAKLDRFEHKTNVELRLGDDKLIVDWPSGRFDAIVASHSFQFWADPATTLSRLRALLSRKGRLVLVIRRHVSREVIDWIPNPITKSRDELAELRKALVAAEFRVVCDERLKTGSHGFVAAHA